MKLFEYFRWTINGLEHADVPTGFLLVADSWLVKDGMSNEPLRHRDRFREACVRIGGLNRHYIEKFWNELITVIPTKGHWFPRAELVLCADLPQPSLGVRVRSAPERSDRIRLDPLSWHDPRTQPRIKGPDIDILERIRKQIKKTGSDEAVLTTDTGVVLEGLTTSIMWWEGDILCAPPLDLPILHGVTREIVFGIAKKKGVRQKCLAKPLAAVLECPIWAVNALHGIRAVSEIAYNPPHPLQIHPLTDEWRCIYEANQTPFVVSR
ncbi:MAG: aminotransferase class IV [Porticoccaceae bacterium]